jgi:hypothetical protein
MTPEIQCEYTRWMGLDHNHENCPELQAAEQLLLRTEISFVALNYGADEEMHRQTHFAH